MFVCLVGFWFVLCVLVLVAFACFLLLSLASCCLAPSSQHSYEKASFPSLIVHLVQLGLRNRENEKGRERERKDTKRSSLDQSLVKFKRVLSQKALGI